MASPFPIDPILTGIAIAYKNEAYIADQVLPRVPVGRQEFKWYKYDLGETFRIPSTLVSRRGQPGEVEFGFTEAVGAAIDYGIEDAIPQADIDNAPDGYDPVKYAAERLTDIVLLDREQRVANIVLDAASYTTGNSTVLSGTSQWSDYTNSDPVTDILTALDSIVMRPNTIVLGQAVWSKLMLHPKVIAACYGSASTTGIVTKSVLADKLEVQQILIGRSWLNSARQGQSASLSRVWGKHAALLHINPLARAGTIPTFGFTAQWGTRVAGSWPDKNVGLRGGVRVRSGESVVETICAPDLGYLFANAVA